MKKKIKIGILLNSYTLPLWEYELIEKLICSEYASIDLIIRNDKKKVKKTVYSKFRKHWKNIVYLIYVALDKKFFKVSPNAFELKDTSVLVQNINKIDVTPISTEFSDRIQDDDIQRIKEQELDILIRFGFGILRGDILTASTYGIWSYHHGDNRINRGGPAGFWEVLENVETTSATLQILSEDLDAGQVLERVSSATNNVSVIRNKNAYYWNASLMLPRKIEELYLLGEDEFFKKVKKENSYLNFYSNRLYSKRNFNNLKMLKLFISFSFKVMKKKIYDILFFEQWILLFSLGQGVSTSFWRFKKIKPPKDRFYADPFVAYENNRYYIFIEELVYSRNKGHISVIEMDKDGNYEKVVKIIERPYHLSYPYIIKDRSDYYLVPESMSNHTIELYKCIEFPYKWEFHMNIMEDINAVDSTFFYYNSKWWLFTNIVEKKGISSNDNLYLFYADVLETTKWIPHPSNPIVSDVTKARSAGNIFVRDNKIIRPSQNSAKSYGNSINMNEILILNEEDYKEVLINEINPNWEKDILRTHTFNYKNNLTVIDAKLQRAKIFK